jgi:hypothetical protein
VRTWDTAKNRLLDTFSPQPNAYYQFAMLSRFLPKYSAVLATRVDASHHEEDRKFVATALRTPRGHFTVVMVNESQLAADLTVEFTGLSGPVRLYRYAITKENEDRCDVDLHPQRSMDVSNVLSDSIPPMSIVVYSSYLLYPSDPGVLVE